MHDIDFTDAFCGRLFFTHMLARNNHTGGERVLPGTPSAQFAVVEWPPQTRTANSCNPLVIQPGFDLAHMEPMQI